MSTRFEQSDAALFRPPVLSGIIHFGIIFVSEGPCLRMLTNNSTVCAVPVDMQRRLELNYRIHPFDILFFSSDNWMRYPTLRSRRTSAATRKSKISATSQVHWIYSSHTSNYMQRVSARSKYQCRFRLRPMRNHIMVFTLLLWKILHKPTSWGDNISIRDHEKVLLTVSAGIFVLGGGKLD